MLDLDIIDSIYIDLNLIILLFMIYYHEIGKLFNYILIYIYKINFYSSELLSLTLVYLKEIGFKLSELPNKTLIYLNKIDSFLNELFNYISICLNKIGHITEEFFNLILIYSKDISFKLNELFLFIYSLTLYPLYLTILLSIIIWIKIFKPEIWKTKSTVLAKVSRRLIIIYSLIMLAAIIIYAIYTYTTLLNSMNLDPNIGYFVFLFRVISITVVGWIIIYKKYIRPNTKDDLSQYIFSFGVSALLVAIINILLGIFILPEFIFIGEGSSGSSGSNSSGNNPGGGAPKPPKFDRDYSSLLWKSDSNSEGSNSKSSVPVDNSETPSNSSKRPRSETGNFDNHYTKRIRQPSSNDNRNMVVLQLVEDYSVAKLRAIKAELLLVKEELQVMEDIIRKVPGGLNSVPANMEWYNMQNTGPSRPIGINSANPPFMRPDGTNNFYKNDLTGTYNVKENRSISAEYKIKIRQKIELEREFAHLKTTSLKIREAAPTGVVRVKYFPKN